MGGTIIDTYGRVINYGVNKKLLRLDRLFLQGFMAGVWVGLAGHACSGAAGGYSDQTEAASKKFIYAAIFPVAFISIILTGAELFTGNTMTMLICVFHRKVSVLDLLINWVITLVSNFLGTFFIAGFISKLSGAFDSEPFLGFVQATAAKKVHYSFLSNFLRGIGANTFVCLAVWQTIAVDDVAGKVLVLWFPIVAFVLAGFEHIIANFYTISLGLLYDADFSVGEAVWRNFVPVLLGNLVGGCVMVGLVYWYTCHDSWAKMQEMDAGQLVREASIQLGGMMSEGGRSGIGERKQSKRPLEDDASSYTTTPLGLHQAKQTDDIVPTSSVDSIAGFLSHPSSRKPPNAGGPTSRQSTPKSSVRSILVKPDDHTEAKPNVQDMQAAFGWANTGLGGDQSSGGSTNT